MNFAFLRYGDGNVQIKQLSDNPNRVFGAKLNGRRPIHIILPYCNKANRALMHSLYLTLHPIHNRGVSFI